MDIVFAFFGGLALVLLPVMAVRAIDQSEGQSRSWVFAWGLIALLATFCSVWLLFSSLLAGLVGIVLAIIYLRTVGRPARPDFVVEEPFLNQADSQALADELKRLEAERNQGKRL